jgi:N-dimethylarginine dimethylaminohydrolase
MFADWRRPSVLLMRDPRSLFDRNTDILEAWSAIGFRARPVANTIIEELDEMIEMLQDAGITVHLLRNSAGLSLDSLYVRDSVALTPSGLIACKMEKPNRISEPSAVRQELAELGFSVQDAIDSPGTLEGGDIVWLDDTLCAVGLSYRTNIAGLSQLREQCEDKAEFLPVHLPHYHGPSTLLHLSSLLSVIAKGLVLADVEYLPITFLAELRARGFEIVEILGRERLTLAANVLAIGDRTLIAISGNAETHARLSALGFRVRVLRANHASVLGDGGPTCLTRPLAFDA